MSDNHVFVDTNILVYAHDKDAGRKHVTARQLIAGLWERSSPPGISIQVLQELYVNLVRKKIPPKTARDIVRDYLQWDVAPGDSALLVDAMSLSERWNISYWDAGIIAAARRTGAAILWSEDLSDGQDYGGVKVVNPLP